MKKFAIGALCTVASLAFAQEGTMETTTMGDSPINVFTNVDLNITKINTSGTGSTSPDTGFNLAVGADGVYNFTTAMGVGLGLDFNMLKGDVTGGDIKANYLDVPVSFAYSIQPTNEIGVTFLAGPYVGIPLGDWKAAGTTVDAKMAYGLNLEAHTTWEMMKGFGLGAHVGFKYAFNDLTDEPSTTTDIDTNYWAVGLGVSAKFL